MKSASEVLNAQGTRRYLSLEPVETEAFLANFEAQCVNGTFRFPDFIITQAPGTLKVLEF